MARLIIAAVLVLALSSQAFAQYGGARDMTAAEQRGKLNAAGTKFYITTITGAELKGAWQIDGMAVPMAQVQAMDDMALPDCANDGVLPSYKGLDFDAPRFTVIAGSGNATNLMNINQQRSTFSANVSYMYPFIVTTSATGARTCTHLQPYIDVASGDLMAESLQISVWTRNTTQGATAPIRSSPTCELKGTEMVGCYTGNVQQGSEIQRAPSSAPSVSISSIAPATARPAGAITTISKNTLRCRQGECLRLSPKHSTTSPAYGH